MEISRLNINNKNTIKADFLTLYDTLSNDKNHVIQVMYKENGKLSKNRTIYIRNNQGQWYMTLNKGREMNQRVIPDIIEGVRCVRYI